MVRGRRVQLGSAYRLGAGDGSSPTIMGQRIKECNASLEGWGDKKFGNLKKQINDCKNRYTKNGVYTVRSGYTDGMMAEVDVGDVNIDAYRWSTVWELDTIPKIRMFVWRLLHGILPTALNLTCRFIDVDPICARCGVELETAEHALRDCRWVCEVWESTEFAGCLTMDPLQVWVWGLLGTLPLESMSLFTTFLWMLWWGRNELIFRKKVWNMAEITLKVEVHRAQFLQARSYRASAARMGAACPIWKPTPTGVWKINVDASVRKGVGALIAGVLRDSSGVVHWCFANRCAGIFEVNVAEALAVEKGMELARLHGIKNVVIETDSKLVVRALLQPKVDLSYFGKIVRNILDQRHLLGDVTFAWARRQANMVAHKLASFAFSCDSPFFAFSVSVSILGAVESELQESL
ncbi:hypothetical protein ACS0TY_026418 [Phlomoides rotata]